MESTAARSVSAAGVLLPAIVQSKLEPTGGLPRSGGNDRAGRAHRLGKPLRGLGPRAAESHGPRLMPGSCGMRYSRFGSSFPHGKWGQAVVHSRAL